MRSGHFYFLLGGVDVRKVSETGDAIMGSGDIKRVTRERCGGAAGATNLRGTFFWI